jgi:hypothetical protein
MLLLQPVDNIFLQNTSTPNFISVLLQRSSDPTDKFPGDMTVGEIIPGFEAIDSQPKISVAQVPSADISGQHWQVLLVRSTPTCRSRKGLTCIGVLG